MGSKPIAYTSHIGSPMSCSPNFSGVLLPQGSPMSWQAGSPGNLPPGSPMSWSIGPLSSCQPKTLPLMQKEAASNDSRSYNCCGIDHRDLHSFFTHWEETHIPVVVPPNPPQTVQHSSSQHLNDANTPTQPQDELMEVELDSLNHPNSSLSPATQAQTFIPPALLFASTSSSRPNIPSTTATPLNTNTNVSITAASAPTSTPTDTPPHTAIRTITTLISRPFRCPKPNCNKSYKQANGLKYHMTHGSCSFAPNKDLEHIKDLLKRKRCERESKASASGLSGSTSLDSYPSTAATSPSPLIDTGNTLLVDSAYGDCDFMTEIELKEMEQEAEKRLRPFACGIADCQRRYKNMNGLRYHYQHTGDHGAIGLARLAGGLHESQLSRDSEPLAFKPSAHSLAIDEINTADVNVTNVNESADVYPEHTMEDVISPRHADELSEHNVRALMTRLMTVFEDIQQYKWLLDRRGLEAQQLLDIFQTLLDMPRFSAKVRRNLLVATQRLSKTAGLYPTCYDIHHVELDGAHPVAAGSFADIYKGRFLGQMVCLKVIRIYQTSHVHSFLKKFSSEAILWGQLSHPNLLPIYGLYRYNTSLCLVSPWMENGDVRSFLGEHPEANRALLVADVAAGVAYLHSNDIIHGDLKGANILVNNFQRACLADFGLSAVSDPDILHWTSQSSAASKGGSVRWQAPELFDVDSDDVVHNSKASDVYAMSCVAYEIFTGNIPFHELPRDSTVTLKVKAGAKPSRPSQSSLAWGPWRLTEPIWLLMQMCWNTKSDARPTVNDFVVAYAIEIPRDDRPVGNEDFISPAHFRDSVGRSTLPSFGEIESMLSGVRPK